MLSVKPTTYVDWLLALYVVLREHNRLSGRGVDAEAKIANHLLSLIDQSSQLQIASAQQLALQLLRLVGAGMDREFIETYAGLVLKNRISIAEQESGLLEMICRVIGRAYAGGSCGNCRLDFALELGRQWIPVSGRPSSEALRQMCRRAWCRHLGNPPWWEANPEDEPGALMTRYFQGQALQH